MYSEDHLKRLLEIRSARARGASLQLIKAHLAQGGVLDAPGIDRSWLPVTRATAPTPRRRPARTAVPLDEVLSASPDRADLSPTIDTLIEHGVLERRGDSVLAERSLAAGLTGVVTHGMPVERVLEVLATAAGAGASIGTALDTALSDDHDQDSARHDLIDLVAHTLSTVVRA